MGLPGDQCFYIEIFDFTQCVVDRKKIVLHWLRLCAFGDEFRGTGNRNMASDVVHSSACVRRCRLLLKILLHFTSSPHWSDLSNVKC